MRKFTVELQAAGWVALDCRRRIISGPHDEEWKAHLYGRHAANAPSLVKSMKLKRTKHGVLVGRPFWGVKVEACKTKNRGWIADVTVDGEVRIFRDYKTRNALLEDIRKIGREQITMRNAMTGQPFTTSRATAGTTSCPSREAYWSA